MGTKETLQEVFEVGKKYSLYKIDEMMAMCWCKKITIKEVHERHISFTEGRGRKRFIIRFDYRSYQSAPFKPMENGVFEGWEQPIKTDTEAQNGVMRGNACYNFIGTPEAVRAWIEDNQLNPNFRKSVVIAIEGQGTDALETVVYPELESDHAVIKRVLADQNARVSA